MATVLSEWKDSGVGITLPGHRNRPDGKRPSTDAHGWWSRAQAPEPGAWVGTRLSHSLAVFLSPVTCPLWASVSSCVKWGHKRRLCHGDTIRIRLARQFKERGTVSGTWKWREASWKAHSFFHRWVVNYNTWAVCLRCSGKYMDQSENIIVRRLRPDFGFWK